MNSSVLSIAEGEVFERRFYEMKNGVTIEYECKADPHWPNVFDHRINAFPTGASPHEYAKRVKNGSWTDDGSVCRVAYENREFIFDPLDNEVREIRAHERR